MRKGHEPKAMKQMTGEKYNAEERQQEKRSMMLLNTTQGRDGSGNKDAGMFSGALFHLTLAECHM